MRTTLNLAEDALIAARNIAQREHLPLGEAVSELIRRGSATPAPAELAKGTNLRGRFALLPARDEIITPQHVSALMERERVPRPHT